MTLTDFRLIINNKHKNKRNGKQINREENYTRN